MKKRIFGIRLSTILTAIVCLVVALLIWMTVKYRADVENTAFSCLSYFLRG